LIAVVPLLLIRTAAVNPVFHSLLMTYWQLPDVAALLELLATELELIPEVPTLDHDELEELTVLELLERLLLLVETLLELAPTMP